MKAAYLAIALLFPASALASSDDAWADLARSAKTACTAQIKVLASGLKITGVSGTVLGIGGRDNDQFYALILKGRGKGYTSEYLCLYDKRTKKAQVGELGTS